MQILANQAKEGCILLDDIYSMTNKPIIPKRTVLNRQHLEVLKFFLISTINVESTLVTGEAFHPMDKQLENNEIELEPTITSEYLHAVKEYKEQFIGWQSGSPVDIARIRQIMIPLIEKFMENTSEIFTIHHYSTKRDYFYHHSVSVGILSAFLTKKLGYKKGDLIQVAIAGVLGDCGMAKIDPKILNKPYALSLEEFSEIKKHPAYSFQMVKKITAIKDEAKLAILQHHERIDGSGYPLGLKIEKIHPFSNILAVADVYHAMISERLYRSKQSPFKVLEEILQDNFGKFDIKVIDALTSGIANLFVGTKVKLSNDYIGEIIFVEEKAPTRPMIKLAHNGEIIQLKNNRSLFIEEIL